MSDANAETLRSYESRIAQYIDGTPPDVPEAWLDDAVSGLDAGARIVEIGSAYGRDAAYIQARGFRIECTDAAAGFVRELVSRGFDARPFNLLADRLDPVYDLILANAVLLHFERAHMPELLRRLRGGLKPGGRLAFSLKDGEGEGWSEEKIGAPRYFCYWRHEQLPPLLKESGFPRWRVEPARITHARHPHWLFVTARAGFP
jgi:SAM-dependent methyltransferase